MRAPDFWWRPAGLAARLLAPAGALYGAVAARRMARPGAAVGVPVICVGNFVAGGAGKTPTVAAIAALAAARGARPVVVSRGYGGSAAGPVMVDPARHAAAEVGDEPLMLARDHRVIVARDRLAGARAAVADGADLIVLDDGMQSPALVKDLVVAVVDGARGFGNRLCLPAGPLRAPLAAQFARVGLVLVIGEGAPGEAAAAEAARAGLAMLYGRLVPHAAVAAQLAGRRVLAFAGIGRPAKLAETLRELGAEMTELRAFPDHHVYGAGELAALAAAARRADAIPVTTEKDAARISALAVEHFGKALVALPVRLEVRGEGLAAAVAAVLER